MVNASNPRFPALVNSYFTKVSLKNLAQKLFGPSLSRIEISTPETARFICGLIPNQCPFERDIVVFGHKLFHIPALCKLNPLYESFVELRFRALVFLADECGEDVTQYCQ
jgi:Mo-dependent nitrogenase C-terminus